MEILDENRKPIRFKTPDEDMSYSEDRVVSSTSMRLLVFQGEKPKIETNYESWFPAENKPNLYQRKINFYWENSSPSLPPGYTNDMSRPDYGIWLDVKVAPTEKVNNIKQVSWISPSGLIKVPGPSSLASVQQFFLYDPTRDAPRDLEAYVVKIKVVP